MTLNIIDIIILAILGISLVSGMYKGFLASGLAVIGFVAAWFGAMHFYPQLSAALQANTSLMGIFRYYLDANAFFGSGGIAEKAVSAISQTELAQAAASLKLPAVIVNAFQENVASGAFSRLGLNTLGEYLGQTISGAALNVLSFLVMFIVSYVVVLLVVNLLNHVFRFPVLRHMDWLLGGLFGLARGVVVVMLVFSLVPLINSVVPMEIADELLGGSVLYDWFNRADILSKLTQSVF